MAIVRIKCIVDAEIEKVWETVTSLHNFSWRSDLSKVEILSDNEFIEYTKDGYQTKFTITNSEVCKQWSFDLENTSLTGHWKGNFTSKNGQTEIEFTEDVTPKKIIMKPFIKMYLKKQQLTYIEDLKKAVEDNS